MEATLNLVSIIIIVFGILQIILFFKLWGMTNDIREMKDKYMKDNYNRTVEGLREIKDKYIKNTGKEDYNKDIEDSPKNLPITNTPKNEQSSKEETHIHNNINLNTDKMVEEIDIESEDFKKLINRWKVLKKGGFIKQAIDEYIEKTSLSNEDATKFIEEL